MLYLIFPIRLIYKMKEKKVMKLASRGKRLGAFCIDAAVPVITAIMYIAAAVTMAVKQAMNFGNFGFGYGYGYPGYGFGYEQDRGTSTAMTKVAPLPDGNPLTLGFPSERLHSGFRWYQATTVILSASG